MIYTYSQLLADVLDATTYANTPTQLTLLAILNRAARTVLSENDLRSMKRRAATSPFLFDEVFDYACPTDLKSQKFIDLQPQIDRTRHPEWGLTTQEEFDRLKNNGDSLVAFANENGLRRLRVSAMVPSDIVTPSTLDDTTSGGGTWVAVGDATNVTADGDNYVKGSGSIRFDISGAGGTTAGIKNTGLDAFDYSDFVDFNRSIFVWAYVTSPTNLTNYIIRVGSSESDYHQITVTTTNEATAFHVGWNLLRFDFSSKTTTGTPDTENATFVSLYMTKTSGKINETGYRFDHIIMEGGIIHDLLYYTKYPWQTSAGTYIENSTTGTDLLNADTEEYDLFVLKGKDYVFNELKDFDLRDDARALYKDKRTLYMQQEYQSEAKPLTTFYN